MAGTARITIEVADEGALAKFRELGRASEESFRQIGEAGGHVSSKGFEQAAHSAGRATEASHGLREIIHTLHPVLETAGLGLNNLGSFAAAARGGLLGLAAAITGAALVGLEKLQDSLALTSKRMGDLGATKTDIEALVKAAKELGVGPEVLAKGYESTAAAIGAAGGPEIIRNPYYEHALRIPYPESLGSPVPGGPAGARRYTRVELEKYKAEQPPVSPEIEFQKQLFQITRLGAGTVEDAKKEYEAITTALKPKEEKGVQVQGAVTPEIIRGLSPGTARELGRLYNLPDLKPGAANETPNQQLERFGPKGLSLASLSDRLFANREDIDKRYGELKKDPQLTDAIGDVVEALRGLAEKVARVGLADELEKITKAINQFADTLENNPVVRYLAGPKVTPDKGGEGTAEKPFTGKVELPPTGFDIIKYLYSLPNPPPLVSLPTGLTPSAPLTTVPPVPGSFTGAVREATATPAAGQAPQPALLKPLDLGDTLATVSTELRTGAQTLKSGFDQALQVVLAFAAQLRAVNLKPPEQAAAGQGGGEGHAGGGHIRGSGTSTSDSIPAMLSDGEFVQPTAAVKHYGLDHMEDIRTLRAPRLNAGGFVGLRFNSEGLIASMGASARHLADGGVAASSSALSSSSSGPTHAVHVHLSDGSEHGPMLTDRETAENLVDHIEQQSVLYRLASGGRRSSAQS